MKLIKVSPNPSPKIMLENVFYDQVFSYEGATFIKISSVFPRGVKRVFCLRIEDGSLTCLHSLCTDILVTPVGSLTAMEVTEG